MATCTHETTLVKSSASASWVSGSFTPADGDLLLVAVIRPASTIDLSDTQGLGWTVIVQSGGGQPPQVSLFVSNQLASASSMTVTATLGASSTGVMFVTSVTPALRPARTGISAIRQSTSNGASANASPSISFPQNCLTANATIVYAGNSDNPANIAPNASWTEQADTGAGTNGMEYATRNSGFISTVHNWSAGVTNGWAAAGVEIDTTAAPDITAGRKGFNPPILKLPGRDQITRMYG